MSADVMERSEEKVATTFIYALCEPSTGEIRYVGKSDNPKRRLNDHLRDGTSGSRTYKAKWIRSLTAVDASPVLAILAEVPVGAWQAAERSWIARLLDGGRRLTNGTEGGAMSPAVCAEHSRLMRGRKMSAETRRKMSATAKSISNGRPPIRYGADNNKARLTDEKVAWLRREAHKGCDIADLSRELGIATSSGWQAATGRTWKQVAEAPVLSGPRSKLTAEQIVEIKSLVSAGIPQYVVGKRFSVTQSRISTIVNPRRMATT